mmetsp:Transcript_124208/g.359213  ORF Transcript_124208/g.359213 Transcript_124208/m.359213 type:complete len:215 (+) Transcript_124208:371-1015(+)
MVRRTPSPMRPFCRTSPPKVARWCSSPWAPRPKRRTPLALASTPSSRRRTAARHPGIVRGVSPDSTPSPAGTLSRCSRGHRMSPGCGSACGELGASSTIGMHAHSWLNPPSPLMRARIRARSRPPDPGSTATTTPAPRRGRKPGAPTPRTRRRRPAMSASPHPFHAERRPKDTKQPEQPRGRTSCLPIRRRTRRLLPRRGLWRPSPSRSRMCLT